MHISELENMESGLLPNIDRYYDIYRKVYATASAVYRWEKFDLKKKNELKALAKKYTDWIHK